MKSIGSLVVSLCWLGGVFLSSGWWCVLALLVPPYALYVVAARIITHFGL